MCYNNLIIQCIPLHCSVCKTISSNILYTAYPNLLYMTSCPSVFFCHQHQVFLVYLFNDIDCFVH
ncbi:hypothetical protein E2C01_030732 [Portunus trituberculatus]|uniref:Uncharacterized protein n=1 Tax=Portunus trituberculatus TaxID=210409 RepID=A0A5B7EVM5_PORTR|nr:hypothetical protein [Portunus trituberculatus]